MLVLGASLTIVQSGICIVRTQTSCTDVNYKASQKDYRLNVPCTAVYQAVKDLTTDDGAFELGEAYCGIYIIPEDSPIQPSNRKCGQIAAVGANPTE